MLPTLLATKAPMYIKAGSSPATHATRVAFLDCLATLLGCTGSLAASLPDGLHPDVVRFDALHGLLFIGDAKHTESPGLHATRSRLVRYLRWVFTHIAQKEHAAIFAICFGRQSDTILWIETIELLARDVEVEFTSKGVEHFASDIILAWFFVRKPSATTDGLA